MNPDISVQIVSIADAYRRTLLAGDQQPDWSLVDHKLIQAMVASSAASLETWVQTRVPNGVAVAKPLTDLIPAVSKGDIIGKSLKSLSETLANQAKALASAAVWGSTLPLWVGAVLAFIGGLLVDSQEAGVKFGTLLLGGGSIVAAVVRGAAMAAPKLGSAAGSLLSATDAIGSRPERLFASTAQPLVDALFRSFAVNPPKLQLLGQIRGSAKAVVLGAYLLLGLCALFFGYGVYQAFDAKF